MLHFRQPRTSLSCIRLLNVYTSLFSLNEVLQSYFPIKINNNYRPDETFPCTSNHSRQNNNDFTKKCSANQLLAKQITQAGIQTNINNTQQRLKAAPLIGISSTVSSRLDSVQPLQLNQCRPLTTANSSATAARHLSASVMLTPFHQTFTSAALFHRVYNSLIIERNFLETAPTPESFFPEDLRGTRRASDRTQKRGMAW